MFLLNQLMVMMNFLISWVYLDMHQVRFHFIKNIFFFENFTLDVRVVSSLHFNMGLCFTVNPLIKTRGAWKDFGYSIMLEHNLTDDSQSLTTINPGWHTFIHEESEKFSGED